MGLYVNPNPDNLEGATDVEYVEASFLIKSKPEYAVTRWQVEAGRGWEIQETYTTSPNEHGEFLVYVNAKRVPTTVLSGMFAYIIATFQFEDELYVPVIPQFGAIHYTDGGVENG